MTGIRQTNQWPNTAKLTTGPKVTVLISTYNRPAYLAEALESIFAQTYPNFEIVLVRDGGQPVRDVVSRFDDDRLIFIDRDENRGLPRSFNEALSHATGEYICYLGDDDKFYPFHIETLLRTILQNPDYGVVYSDLYKAHCHVLNDGRRRVLAKNVEISRDFDRLLMLQFNHALHVSLMHRRDLLIHAGCYNEKLNVMIDWDLTHRLSFYTDFLHVPIVTGEYYGPVGDCDRISVQRRKNVNDYLRNVLTIRTTRPPQPWPKVEDLAVLIPARQVDEAVLGTIRDLWSHSFYPNQIFVPVAESERSRFHCGVPNVVAVPVNENDSLPRRLGRMLAQVNAPLTAIVTAGTPIPEKEVVLIERALYPLLQNKNDRTVYEIEASNEIYFGGVLRTAVLQEVLNCGCPAQNADSLRAFGLEVRKPKNEELPFQFDSILCGAELLQIEGQWRKAAAVYDYMAEHYSNEFWMRTRQANALYHAKQYKAAAQVAAKINAIRPTVTTYAIEARARKKCGDCKAAIELYARARAIMMGKSHGCLSAAETLIPKTSEQAVCVQPEENLVWT